jgi:hypothetical protein
MTHTFTHIDVVSAADAAVSNRDIGKSRADDRVAV